MHMADALISPEVGGAMWLASGAAIVHCSRKVNERLDDFKVPLMGVMSAFVFAAQMINFTIPGTGSSGHIVGGLLLSVLLGPYAALLAIASVLVVQSLFFADGGLLALGCNIFNMGVIPCLLAYPLLYKPLAGDDLGKCRIWLASLLTSISALTLGAFCVVLETWSSEISELPFSKFLLMMVPIHIAIGAVEGAATAAILVLIRGSRPELLRRYNTKSAHACMAPSLKWAMSVILVAALGTAGVFSWFASENPDGLEWSIAKITGTEELQEEEAGVKSLAERVQKSMSFFSDYSIGSEETSEPQEQSSWGSVAPGTSLAGAAGTIFTLLLAFSVGMCLRKRNSHLHQADEAG